MIYKSSACGDFWNICFRRRWFGVEGGDGSARSSRRDGTYDWVGGKARCRACEVSRL